MLAQVLGRCHFQENVHEDLESDKVDFLREKCRKHRKRGKQGCYIARIAGILRKFQSQLAAFMEIQGMQF